MNANAIEFDAAIDNGTIHIPGQYQNFAGKTVRVLIFPLEETNIVPDDPDLGILSRRKNIWDFMGKIKARGSAEEERESMIEAAVDHAMGGGETH